MTPDAKGAEMNNVKIKDCGVLASAASAAGSAADVETLTVQTVASFQQTTTVTLGCQVISYCANIVLNALAVDQVN
jgi:hypothetical protein